MNDKVEIQKCRVCNANFVARSKLQKTCSKNCSEVSTSMRLKEYYRRPEIRAKKLAYARNYFLKPVEIRTCTVCGRDFKCGHEFRSRKAFSCSKECQRKYNKTKLREYILDNYEKVRAVDNAGHAIRRKNPDFKSRERKANAERNRKYRASLTDAELIKFRAHNRQVRREWVLKNPSYFRDRYRKNPIVFRMATQRCKVRKATTLNFFRVLNAAAEIAKAVNKQQHESVNNNQH